MKKRIMFCILFMICGVFFTSVYASEESSYTYVNPYIFYQGKALKFIDSEGDSIQPINYNGTTYLPVRYLSEALGLTVNWLEDIRTVQLMSETYKDENLYEIYNDYIPSDKINIKVDYDFLNLVDSNGEKKEPFIVDGVTYVPLRFISNALGFDVSYSSESDVITLRKSKVKEKTINEFTTANVTLDYTENIVSDIYIKDGKVYFDIYYKDTSNEKKTIEISTLKDIKSVYTFENIQEGLLLNTYVCFIDKNKDVYKMEIPKEIDYFNYDYSSLVTKVNNLENIIDMYYVNDGIFFLGDKNYYFSYEDMSIIPVYYSMMPIDKKAVDVTLLNPYEDVTMTFVGDIYLSDYVLNKYNSNGIDGILSKQLLEPFNEADIFMANQEFAFSTRGVQAEDKQYTFRVNPMYVSIFTEMGMDIATLANNHTLDFGTTALVDSMDTLDNANIEFVGVGNNIDEAKESKVIEINDKKFAFLGASRVIPVYDWNATSSKAGMLTTYDSTILVEEIKKAKEENDFVVVYVHWGVERATTPEQYQRDLGKAYIDAGADLVIGSHPHVLQGIEYYNGKPIVYSLGNFIFYNNIEKTAVVNATVDEDNNISLQILPCSANNSQTYLIEDDKKIADFYNYMESISFGVDIDENGFISEK
ncbi:MAG: CapA family protein [Lachnospirales bacterium]